MVVALAVSAVDKAAGLHRHPHLHLHTHGQLLLPGCPRLLVRLDSGRMLEQLFMRAQDLSLVLTAPSELPVKAVGGHQVHHQMPLSALPGQKLWTV